MAAKGIELASAYVSLSVSTDGIPREVERAFRGIDKSADRAGRKTGKTWGDAFDDGVSKTTDGLKRKLKELEAAEKRHSRSVIRRGDKQLAAAGKLRVAEERLEELRAKGSKVKKSQLTAASEAREKAFREEAQAIRDVIDESDELVRVQRDIKKTKAEIKLDADTTAATAQVAGWRRMIGAKPVNVKVKADLHGSHRQVGALANDLERIRRSDVLKVNVAALGVASLPAIATGIAEVAAALVQLSQAALAVPGAVAGAASSIGTLLFGVSGMSDAYTALADAQDEAEKAGKGLSSQARSQRSASFGLRNAIRDEAEARKDVNRAIRDTKRDLQDLNLQMRGGIISEKRAVLEAQKARERLYSGDYSDYRDALLDVEEADLRVAESRTRNVRTFEELSDASAKGVMGSDRVADANERLVRSQQAVEIANMGVAASAPGAEAAHEMSKLSQNAQEFLEVLIGMKGPMDTLRNSVQDKIFEGLAGQLTAFADTALPRLEKGLLDIGGAWNDTFTEMFDVFGTDRNLSLIESIFGNTADAQRILNEAFEPMIHSLLVLGDAGSDSLSRIAEGFGDLMERFDNFITAADEDGSLDEWINEGLDALTNLGNALLNIGKMFTAINDAAGGTFLEGLADITDKWQEWMNSVEGQDALKDFFAEGRAIAQQWRPILEDLPGLFQGIYNGAKTYMDLLLPVLDQVTSILAEWPSLIETAVAAFLIFKAAKVIGAIGVLSGKLLGIETLLGVSMPMAAEKGAPRISAALARIAIPAWLAFLIRRDSEFGDGTSPGGLPSPNDHDPRKRSNAEMLLGPWLGPKVDNVLGTGANASGFDHSNGGAPGQSLNSRNLLNEFGAGGAAGGPSLGGSIATVPGSTGSEYGLQNYTIGVKRAIETHFPSIETIGGYRQDRLTWHPHGKAIDVMIPGGTTRGGLNPQGRAIGDRIWSWLQTNGPAMGVDVGASLWQTDQGGDHYDHIHIATLGGGYPAGAAVPQDGDRSASRSGPSLLNPPPPPSASAPSTTPSAGPGGGSPRPGGWSPRPGGAERGLPPLAPAPAAAAPRPGVGSGSPTPTLDDLFGVTEYDTGGWWESGTLGVNNTGKPELVLNTEQQKNLADSGVDPNSLLHGSGGGSHPGPSEAPQPKDPAAKAEGLGRTEGFKPAAAANINPVGEGGLASIMDLGESAIHNLIDTGAQLASAAATSAIAAGSFGAGAAAGPAASTAISMGAEAAKRGVSYGYDLAGIWGEALLEQASPFGQPRWLGSVTPMQFIPNIQIPGMQPGQGVPDAPPGSQSVPDPNNPWSHVSFEGVQNPAQHGHAGQQPTPGPGPEGRGPQPGPQQPPDPNNPLANMFAQLGAPVFDSGGVLPPKGIGVNLSNEPEYITTQQQMAAGMQQVASITDGPRRGGDTNNFYSQDLDGMFREYEKQRRREARTYSGRP